MQDSVSRKCVNMMTIDGNQEGAFGIRTDSSDGEVHYTSNKFQTLLKIYGIQRNMSQKGDCGDNAVTEYFFHTLNVELN